MGVFKKYAPAIASDALRMYPYSTERDTILGNGCRRIVPTWYDLNGTAHSELVYSFTSTNTSARPEGSCKNVSLFIGLTPYATEDILDDFNILDYGISEIPGTATTFSESITKSATAVDRVMNIRITNNISSENNYIQNTDPIWRDYKEYYRREGEEGSYVYIQVSTKPNDFNTTYNTYWILVSNMSKVVKCIKFKRPFYVQNGIDSYPGYNACAFAYFLDESEWIVIPSGESRSLVVDFSAATA